LKTLIVLAGGFGTRLRTAVSDVPKPLAPVCGKPFLQYLIENAIKQGINDFIFLLHYEAKKIQDMLQIIEKNEACKDISFRTLLEKKPLGTGGAISNALKELDIKDSFLVINADTWLSEGLKLMSNSLPPAMATVKVKDSSRYGNLSVKDGFVEDFKEKNTLNSSGMINAGMYHFHSKDFHQYNIGDTFSLEEKVLYEMTKNKKLRAITLETFFIDIGVPEDYIKFCKLMESGALSEF